MTEPARIIRSTSQVATALADIGVAEDLLANAVTTGFQYAATCTENDPANFEGLMFWARTVRHLRDELIAEKGWVRGNDRNYATVVRPDGYVQIAVAAGDSAVGKVDASPTTRTQKGTLTKEAIVRNQMSFFFMESDRTDVVPSRRTWILLHYLDNDVGEIRLELSLPSVMDDADYVIDWSHRIILAPISTEKRLAVTDDDDLSAYNVEVEPRRGQ